MLFNKEFLFKLFLKGNFMREKEFFTKMLTSHETEYYLEYFHITQVSINKSVYFFAVTFHNITPQIIYVFFCPRLFKNE